MGKYYRLLLVGSFLLLSLGLWGQRDLDTIRITPAMAELANRCDKLYEFRGRIASGRMGKDFFYFNNNGKIILKDTIPYPVMMWVTTEPYYTFRTRELKDGFVNDEGEIFDITPFKSTAFSFSNGVLAVQQKDKWGYVDYLGNMLLPCEYSSVGRFIFGCGKVSSDNKVGFVNRKGDFIVPLIYSEILEEYVDKELTAKYNGKWGVVDTMGRVVLPFIFDDDNIPIRRLGNYFRIGPVDYNNNVWGLVDSVGKVVLPRDYEYFYPIRNSSAVIVSKNLNRPPKATVKLEEGLKVDLPHRYNVSEGKTSAEPEYRYGVADGTGKWLVPLEYEFIQDDVAEGLLLVKRQGRYGLLRTSDWTVEFFEPDISVVDVEDGMIKVYKDSLVGFLDSTGRQVIPCIYESADSFEEGLSLVKKDNKYGLIDKSGRVVVPMEYKMLSKPYEGAIAACKDSLWGYIDTLGQVIVPFEYDFAFDFSKGLGVVEKDNRTHKGMVDVAGNMVVPCIYDDLENRYSLGRGTYMARMGSKFGLLGASGQVIHPCVYDSMEGIYQILLVRKGDKWGYVDVYGGSTFDSAEIQN